VVLQAAATPGRGSASDDRDPGWDEAPKVLLLGRKTNEFLDHRREKVKCVTGRRDACQDTSPVQHDGTIVRSIEPWALFGRAAGG
jgi:hypothetical protein